MKRHGLISRNQDWTKTCLFIKKTSAVAQSQFVLVLCRFFQNFLDFPTKQVSLPNQFELEIATLLTCA